MLLVDDLQLVGFEDARDLIARMDRPWTGVVELEIDLPVLQCLARFAQTLVSQRQVVMGVGICGGQLDRGLIGRNRFDDSAGFVQHIAEVEVGQRVAGVGSDG